MLYSPALLFYHVKEELHTGILQGLFKNFPHFFSLLTIELSSIQGVDVYPYFQVLPS